MNCRINVRNKTHKSGDTLLEIHQQNQTNYCAPNLVEGLETVGEIVRVEHQKLIFL